MQQPLKLADLEVEAQKKIYVQKYAPEELIEGVKIFPVETHISEDGDFSEVMRIDSQGEVEGIPGFKIAQINRTKLYPQTIKAWHVHFCQDEVWYISPIYQVFVGLWDIRKDSRTCGKTMRVNLGGGKSQLLFIPRGVAHGSANFSFEYIQLYYFVNALFDPKNPDERRIKWDAQGADFWKPHLD